MRPSKKLTLARVREVLDAAESELERCWSLFHQKKDPERTTDVLLLQPLLAKILTETEAVYREVVQERQSLVSRKGSLSGTWFKRRMRALDNYAKSLKVVLGVGRTIGDGFAWLFYRNDGALIEQHLETQRQPMLPPGAGGRGERMFLERFQNTSGTLAIYHGLTSYLRIGDFSFFDPVKKRIVAIGELKTVVVEGGGHELHMKIIARYDSKLAQLSQEKGGKVISQARRTLPDKQVQRLSRQIAQIISAIKEAEKHENAPSISANKGIDFSKLQSVLEVSFPRGVKREFVGKGLLLMAIACPGSIFDRNLKRSRGNIAARLRGIEKDVIKLLNPGATDNALTLSSVGVSGDHQPIFMPGTVPLFWWPIREEQMRDLIFGRIMVFSAYNPSHIFQVLTQRGYKLEIDAQAKLTKATKNVPGGKSIVVKNFSQLQKMSALYLLDEDVIENFVDAMEKQWLAKSKEGFGRVQVKPRLVF